MKSNPFTYSIKIWTSSVLIGPALFFTVGAIHHPVQISEISGFIPMYLLFVFFEFLFSVITWAIFWAIIELIAGNIENNILRKSIISAVGAGLTVATFYIFPFLQPVSLTDGSCVIMLANCLCIFAGCWYFDIAKPAPDTNSSFINTNTYEQSTE